jgi:RecB family exonuclease
VPVDAASLLDARLSLDRAEFDRLVVAAASGAGRFDRLAGLCLESAVLRRAIPGDAARWRSDRFTIHDGFIESPAGREALAQIVPAGKMWSASRLETYAECPFKYWVKHYLGIDSRDNPEDQEGADNRERGTLIHEILSLFMSEHRDAVLDSGARSDLRMALLRVADERIALFEREKVTGYPLRWSVDAAALKDDLLVWLDFELDRAGASPARGFEVGFGMTPRDGEDLDPGSSPDPAWLRLGDGREVAFHGKIDRIDFDPERGHARVVDYKSGRKPKTARRGLDGGRNLQLPMYLHALTGILPGVRSGEAEYLYLRNETCPVSYAMTGFPEMRRDLADVVAPLIAGIEAGHFFAAPGHCDWRGECEFKSICGVRIEDRFDRKRNDPRVAAHPSVSGPDNPQVSGDDE